MRVLVWYGPYSEIRVWEAGEAGDEEAELAAFYAMFLAKIDSKLYGPAIFKDVFSLAMFNIALEGDLKMAREILILDRNDNGGMFSLIEIEKPQGVHKNEQLSFPFYSADQDSAS